MYALHPATIHFPIALLLLNLALTLWYLRRPDPFIERAAFGALLLGWWSTVAAVASGLLAAALEWPPSSAVLGWLNAHAVLGLALLPVYGQALQLRRRNPQILSSPQRRKYLTLLGIGALMVVVGGWIGGHMVYQLGVGVQR